MKSLIFRHIKIYIHMLFVFEIKYLLSMYKYHICVVFVNKLVCALLYPCTRRQPSANERAAADVTARGL